MKLTKVDIAAIVVVLILIAWATYVLIATWSVAYE